MLSIEPGCERSGGVKNGTLLKLFSAFRVCCGDLFSKLNFLRASIILNPVHVEKSEKGGGNVFF